MSTGNEVVVKQTGEPKGWFSIERVVALATPVFAAAGGYVFSILGKAIPGINLPKGDFVDLFIAGGTLATTASLTWLLGRQKFVHFVQGAERVSDEVSKAVQSNIPQSLPELRRIEAALEAHEAAIVDGVAQKIGAPASAAAVAQEVIKSLLPPQQGQPSTTAAGVVVPASGEKISS